MRIVEHEWQLEPPYFVLVFRMFLDFVRMRCSIIVCALIRLSIQCEKNVSGESANSFSTYGSRELMMRVEMSDADHPLLSP